MDPQHATDPKQMPVQPIPGDPNHTRPNPDEDLRKQDLHAGEPRAYGPDGSGAAPETDQHDGQYGRGGD